MANKTFTLNDGQITDLSRFINHQFPSEVWTDKTLQHGFVFLNKLLNGTAPTRVIANPKNKGVTCYAYPLNLLEFLDWVPLGKNEYNVRIMAQKQPTKNWVVTCENFEYFESCSPIFLTAITGAIYSFNPLGFIKLQLGKASGKFGKKNRLSRKNFCDKYLFELAKAFQEDSTSPFSVLPPLIRKKLQGINEETLTRLKQDLHDSKVYH